VNTPKLTISVVICAYTEERWQDLEAALDSLQHQTLQPEEILLVIDHHFGLYAHARDCFPSIRVIENREKRGLSGARNTGIAAAQGGVIAFLDEDAIAEQDWIERLHDGYADPMVMGVGGAIDALWQDARPSWFPEEFDWVVGCTYPGLPLDPAPVRNLIGCNMSFRREVFEAIGGFYSELGRIGALPLGCEETEFCIRTRQHWLSGVLLYEPRARVQHKVPTKRSRWLYFRRRCYAEGLSKAQVTGLVGSRDGLASERSYTMRTLPKGVLKGVRDSLRQRKLDGLSRAAAILAGLVITTFGYLVGRISKSRSTMPYAPENS
jgi:GT2 family glycosyltransferase